MRLTTLATALGLAAATALSAAAPAPAAAPAAAPARSHCPRLSDRLDWYGDNRDRLQEVIDAYGTCARPGMPAGERPVAAFDWDNTVTKNDVTDLAIAWALKHDKLLRPADWADTSPWLTAKAVRALTDACGTDVPVGAPLPTSTDTDCTDEIFSIRSKARLMNGDDAFEGEWNSRRTLPEYAWVPQLFAGRTPAEVTSYARRSRAEALAAPIGATQRVGSHTVHAYARYYPQMKDLIKTLQRAGFEVWIDSAGATPITNAWAGGVGVDRQHTLAIRNVLDRRGRITTTIKGCGGEPDGKGETITYIEGKRCRLNEAAFGITGPAAWERQDARHRPVIAAGDSTTDISIVEDAVGAHLAVNRNKDELMCRAYDNEDGAWLVQPMFIDPLPKKPAPYPCATTGYTNPDGTLGPVLREDGSTVPDQEDTVHG